MRRRGLNLAGMGQFNELAVVNAIRHIAGLAKAGRQRAARSVRRWRLWR
jgi:hypothetical protein